MVRDFALVESLQIGLREGLTVITGESGAGKSILLGALGLVLGDRADTDSIRPGAKRADVSAEFDLRGQPAASAFLAERDLEDADHPERCLVRRVVNQEGRSKAFINGAPVTRGLLREFAENLVDIHGQHEHQRLAEPATQLRLLDDYGVDPALLASCRNSYRSWQRALADADALEEALASKEDRASLLAYQLEELASLGLEPGEFEALETEHKRLSQAQHLRDSVGQSLVALEEIDVLGRVAGTLANLDDEHPALVAARDLLMSADSLTADAVRDLRRYDDSLDVDQGELARLEERLTSVIELARKHRVPPAELVEHLAALQTELDAISTDRGSLDTLRDAAGRHEAGFRAVAAEVSRQRHEAAVPFAAEVSRCMQNLGITGGELRVAFNPGESDRGLESIEYRVITNPKYPQAPLGRIASGGERARISLAIQVVAAEKSALPCLVLDEADVGIGGTTSDVLGRLLRSLARHTQVICVTHAPQVAALGNHHLRVTKSSDQDTRIEPLSDETRIDEVARMLAGSGITEKSRDYARTLLDEAHQALH